MLGHILNGRNELRRQQVAQQNASGENQQNDHHQHRSRRQKNAIDASGLCRQPEHRAAWQQLCIIEGVHIQGVRIPNRLPCAFRKSHLDFRAVGMVRQGFGVCLVIIENAAVGIYPGNPQIPHRQLGQIRRVFKNLCSAEHLRRNMQILAHLLLEQIVVDSRHADGGKHHCHHCHQRQTDVDLLLHAPASGVLWST